MVSPDQPRFGSSAEEQKLPSGELAAQAQRLIGELRQVLFHSPSFLQEAGKYLLEHPHQTNPSIIRFTKSGIPYSFFIWPDEPYDKRILVASKGEGVDYIGISLLYEERGYGSLQPWGNIAGNGPEGTGEAKNYYDSRQAIQIVEAFMRELQVAL